ncbi:class I SAM-dependent methyltransferase [Chitinibacter sp. SCUT-21]|uniref:class I SAM-dependent methyltransferase n=1 Tax=Chitinibacter sp. SCUT-21 TaxID=2970891 RepID=UPI0035A5BB1F
MNSTTHFDQAAATWDADPAKVARAQQVAAAIRRGVAIGAHCRALEYGCGTGLLSFELRADLAHITLADTSEGMLAVLRDKIAAQGISHMQPLALDLTDTSAAATETFDLIYSLMTFHHIPDTQQMLHAFAANLNAGGAIAICDLDTEDGSFHGPDFDGHKGFDRAALQALAEQAGFKQVRFETVFTIAKPQSAGQKSFPLFLMLANK